VKKLLHLFLIIFHLSFFICSGQNHVIDSLQQVLKTEKEDTNKVNTLYETAWKLSENNPDTAIILDKQGLQLAEKIQWKSGEAKSTNDLGWYYYLKGDYPTALGYTNKAITFYEELKDRRQIANMLGNIGLFYTEQGDYPKALEYQFKALKVAEAIGYKRLEGNTLSNIGIIYEEQSDHPKALEYDSMTLKLTEELGNKLLQGNTLLNMGLVYKDQNDYPKALEYNFNALKIAEDIKNSHLQGRIFGNIGAVYQDQKNYSAALEYQFKALKMAEEIGDKTLQANTLGDIGSDYSQAGKFKEAEEYLKQAIALCDSLGIRNKNFDFEINISQLYDTTGRPELALKHYRKAMVLKDSLFNVEKGKQITRNEMNYEFDKKEALAQAEQEKKDTRQRIIRNSTIAGLIVVLAFLLVVYRQRNKIKAGKKRSDELLLNILPEEVAEELKEKGKTDAKTFDEVTVMFTDFKGFTSIAEKLSATELVNEIDYCFKGFDNIIHKYGIEKIKTIGDSYMAASGLPVINKTHAKDMVSAALEIVKFMEQHKQQRQKENKPVFEIRIGINSGHVVAGIVGVKKFAYDIWGDTVNLASRMESSGEVGKVNISGSTYELVKNDFTCTYRGKIQAKNKGEVDMYFIEKG
jgi:adenylate cyclase